MIDIYIYYKVDAAHRELALGGARSVIERMAEETGVAGALGQRADDPLTWLETYRGVTDESRFFAVMDAALNASGVLNCLAGERHVERFVACV